MKADDNVGDIKLGCCCASSSHLRMNTQHSSRGERRTWKFVFQANNQSARSRRLLLLDVSTLLLCRRRLWNFCCCCCDDTINVIDFSVHPSTTHNTLVKSDGEMAEYAEGCRICVRRSVWGHVGMD